MYLAYRTELKVSVSEEICSNFALEKEELKEESSIPLHKRLVTYDLHLNNGNVVDYYSEV
jgi:hypothetical protein